MEEATNADAEFEKEAAAAAKKSKKKGGGRGSSNGNNSNKNKNKPHHVHDADSADDEDNLGEEDEDGGGDQHVFLTKQPSIIKHGNLKPYQLESLNWMIHLAEKGLNGILADEVRVSCMYVSFCLCF